MLLQATEQLDEKLVHVLARRPRSTAYYLHDCLSAYSLQAIYKELRKLQRAGVVVKAGQVHSLRLPWVLEMRQFAEQMEKTYHNNPELILTGHGKQKWQFTNLLQLNDFWSQLLLLLLQNSTSRTIYAWNPHTWFHLLQTAQEAQFIRSLQMVKSNLVLLVGSNSFLDHWAERFWVSAAVEYHFGSRHFPQAQNVYINVIDDYILTVKLAPEANQKISEIYTQNKSLETLNLSEVVRFFSQPHKGTIRLERNPTKASLFTKKMQRIFGPLL